MNTLKLNSPNQIFILYRHTVSAHVLCLCVPVVRASGPEFTVAQTRQKADDLDGLTQSHLISEDATRLLTVEFPHPSHTCLLISKT